MTDVLIQYSTDRGATYAGSQSPGASPGTVGGFDVQRAGTVSYAAIDDAVVKASTFGGIYSAFIATTGAAPVCVIVPYYTRNSTTVKNTTGATPECLVALDQADSDGGTLYWVAGDGTKTDITPTAGMTFDSPNCVTTSYGTHIAVFGKVGGVYHLYTSTNGGTSWTDRGVLTAPHFIRTRRNDTRAKAGGNKGQLFITDGNTILYSRDWGATLHARTMPVTGVLGLDIAG